MSLAYAKPMHSQLSLTELLDRHAERAMLALAGLMMAFFLTFLLVLAQAAGAHAQEGTPESCGGDNLIARYAAEDPEKLAKLEAEASQEANGKAVFWKIEKDGVEPSFLLGTMHMADSRIARLDGARGEAFDASQTVIVENIEALDPAQASTAMLQFKDMTLYTDGSTLADRLDEDTLDLLRQAVEVRGVPFAMAQVMRPWLVATMVALPACELAEKRSGKPVLDGLIASRAKAESKNLVGLETIGEQFGAMAALPEDFHLEALKETLKLGNVAEDVMETMKQLYLDGDIGMILPLTKAVSPKSASSADYEDFKDRLITTRNRNMAERALAHLEKGNAFIAVGALHLPGETGLVAAFRNAGYTVSPVE